MVGFVRWSRNGLWDLWPSAVVQREGSRRASDTSHAETWGPSFDYLLSLPITVASDPGK
jgi:hypothetical protein